MKKKLALLVIGALLTANINVPITKETIVSEEPAELSVAKVAAAEASAADFEYEVVAENVTINQYIGTATEVAIPAEIEGHPVVAIAAEAFKDNVTIDTIVIPDSVTTIGEYAFCGCTSLKNVNLPNPLLQLSAGIFENCTSLTTIEIPKSVLTTEGYGSEWAWKRPFNGCDNLETVVFEEGAKQIPNHIFAHCTGLKNVTIPSTVTQINEYAFYGCSGLTTINLPEGVTNIERSAFENCTGLTKIEMPDSVIETGENVFKGCTAVTEIKISNSLTNLKKGLFSECTSLTGIVIPKSVVTTDGYNGEYSLSFDGCKNLTTVAFEEGTVQIADHIFANCTGVKNVTIPSTVKQIGEYAFYGCSSLAEVNLPDEVTKIDNSVFRECTSLAEVNIPNGVTSLGNDVFYNCTSLTNIEMPDSVTETGTGVFLGCSSLKEVTLSGSLVNLRDGIFKDCISLTSITIPQSVQTTDGYNGFYDIPFDGCINLTTAVFEEGTKQIADHIFSGCTGLKNVKIPATVEKISEYAFFGCTQLKEVKLPYSVTTIEKSAFADAVLLEKVNIPATTTQIDDSAFENAVNVTIYGGLGSYAEEYANAHSISFVGEEVPAESINLVETEVTMSKDTTMKLTFEAAPDYFTDKIIWSSTNTDAVTVDEKGELTAVGKGTATVKVTVGAFSKTCKVTVKQFVNEIQLEDELILNAGEEVVLEPGVYPTDADDTTLKWTCSNPEVITLDENGMITAIGKGTAIITAAAVDEGGVAKSCTVTVKGNLYICDTIEELASPHDYTLDCKDAWKYVEEGAEKIVVTFDEQTMLEEGFDYLYIIDGEGNEVGKYTGSELAGQTVEVEGDTILVRLDTDSAGTAWGFAVASVEAGTDFMLGDVDNNGDINLSDAQSALKAALKITTLDDTATKAADVNKNGTVDLGDAQMILKRALKIIDTFE